jgi:hypothetical protein
MNALVHQLADSLRFIGMRDRLRCPMCKAVGTWKPHGGWFDNSDVRRVRRWMCKWCGWYLGPEGKRWVAPNIVKRCWDFRCPDSGKTPVELVAPEWNPTINAADAPRVWPWRG